MTGRAVFRCWLALMLLLAITTTAAFIPMGSANVFVSLAIAATKALLVLIFFMELRHGPALVRSFAAAGFFWLLIMIVLTGADYWHRSDVRVPLDEIAAPMS